MILLAGSAAIPGIKVDDGEDANGAQWALLAFGLLTVALGTGGIKPNVSSFGADQFDDNIERDRKDKKSFFNWYYFFINVGALIASTVIVKIQDDGYWDIGFGIPAAAMIVAVLLFVFGTPLYRMLPIEGSPLARFIGVTRCALTNRRKGIREASSSNAARKNHWLDWAVGEGSLLVHSFFYQSSFPGHYTADQVYEIKLVYRPLKIFLTLIPFWMVYLQMTGTFIIQAEQMDRNVGLFGLDFKMPSASMTFFNTGGILVFILFYDLCVIPVLKKYMNFVPTDLQRMGAGYFVAVLAMTSALIIEIKRLQLYDDGKYRIELDDDEEETEVVELSIWWQIFPYLLVGLSEILASIASIEFFYSQAPDSMRSMMSALCLLTTSIAGYLSSLLLYIIDKCSTAAGSKWIPDNLNEGHLDYYFIVLIGIMSTTLVVFVFIAMKYTYKEIYHHTHDHETEPILDPNIGKAYAIHEDHSDNEENTTPLLM
eukprot:g5731.t1